MRILHVLDHSLPYLTDYSSRSDYILRAQQSWGWEPVVVTSPRHERFTCAQETIEGIDYHRLGWPSYSSSRLQAAPLVKQMACATALAKEIKRLAVRLQVDVIQAHSPSLNGLAVAQAVKAVPKPWVYELRCNEEDAAVARGETRYNSLRYRTAQRLEQAALEQADRVTTISQAMRADLVQRGIANEKIFTIPHGVDTEFFQPRPPNADLIAKQQLIGNTVIGFIGSFYHYEGLEFLVEAVKLLLNQRRDIKLLLAGEGEAETDLRARVPDEWRAHFIFVGKVPRDEVRAYYSVMDVLVYPRVKSRLTELTTPLAPLEAMAMERVVVGSQVGGLGELVQNGVTGFLVEASSAAALAQCLSQLTVNEGARREMGRQARRFVVRERAWEQIAQRYKEVYRSEQLRLPH